MYRRVNQETLQHVQFVLKIVYSEDALINPSRYTTSNDPDVCCENTRLCFRVSRG